MSSLAKITCIGGKARNSRLSFQEFFGRAVSEKTWGYPAAALLGSVDAQIESGCASIGGKDSMSGTFEKINVPHTLVSFAVGHDEVENVTSGSFKAAGNNIYMVSVPYSDLLAPDYETFLKNSDVIYDLNKSGKIKAMYPVGPGGIAEAVSKMAMGNMIGAELDSSAVGSDVKALFFPTYGNIIIETSENLENAGLVSETVTLLGKTTENQSIVVTNAVLDGKTNAKVEIALADCVQNWESKLSEVFPPVSGYPVQDELPEWATSVHKSLSDIRKAPAFVQSTSKPKVLLPVFPGTNCEMDMAHAFNLAGGNTKIVVLRNKTPDMLAESLLQLEKELKDTQISIPAGPRLGNQVIDAENITKSFGDKLLFENLSFHIPAGAIVGIVGPNGAGKTTLFKMIAGIEKPDSGEIKIGQTVKAVYVDQMRSTLDENKTVYETLSGGADIVKLGAVDEKGRALEGGVREVNAHAYCGWFNFGGADQNKKVGVLSGGEKNRLNLGMMLKESGNVLMLDEPTNDLDVQTVRALEEALEDFAGCALVVSHDRWFLDRICTHILAFENNSEVRFFELSLIHI